MSPGTYDLSLQLAREEMAQREWAAIAARSEVELRDDALLVPFLHTRYRVQRGHGGEVTVVGPSGEVPPQWLSIVILHYLLTATGRPLTGEAVDFRQLVGGEGYLPNFERRAAARLAAEFGQDPERFIRCGLKIGGRQVALGDAAIRVSVFPRVPVTMILWRGDDEFPPSAKYLFDRSISDYLPTEDVVAICQQLVNILRMEE